MTAPGSIVMEDVYKSFRRYNTHTLKDALVRLARREPMVERREVLRGVSLRIEPGERVGILGRNGVGKSTLFRLLSGILAADSGSIRVVGRVAPLIEVTAGFVLDMTGEENLKLNAAIVGVPRRELAQRSAEIVAFAGLEGFMDMPLRYYSSGMQTRLGFSIVSHMGADIVLIDEALAVGDVEFQGRCLEKMDEIARGGATVILISHDFDAVRRFCSRAVWLDDGKVRLDGRTNDVVSAAATPGA